MNIVKRFICFSFIFSVFFVTGCRSSKTLKCYFENFVGETTFTEQNFVLKFMNNKIDSLFFSIDVSLNEDNTDASETLEFDVNDTFKNYQNIDGIDYSSTIRENGYVVNIGIDFDKLDEVDKEKISLINYESTYEEIKIEFENNGFTCK